MNRSTVPRTALRGPVPIAATTSSPRGSAGSPSGSACWSCSPRRSSADALGLEGQETLVRAYGAREVATGVAILASHDPTPWIWGRVAGDAADLATAGKGLRARRPEGQWQLALAAVAAVTVVDVLCASGLRPRRAAAPPRPRTTATAAACRAASTSDAGRGTRFPASGRHADAGGAPAVRVGLGRDLTSSARDPARCARVHERVTKAREPSEPRYFLDGNVLIEARSRSPVRRLNGPARVRGGPHGRSELVIAADGAPAAPDGASEMSAPATRSVPTHERPAAKALP